jgi:dolichol-phosphate mannosyltransferase
LDKKVFKNWKRFKESNRMVLGMVSWMGFNQTSINYDQNTRYSGKSSFNFFKLLKLAIDSFIAYSFAPIRLISLLGIIISSISFFYAIYLIIENLIYKTNITGWTSLMVIVLFLGGVQLITLGIIGEYVWRGVDESRNRPLYLISKKINFKE